MKRPTSRQQKAIVDQWKQAERELLAVRQRELAEWEYSWEIVDALLEIGARHAESKPTSGLVEMQRLFGKLRSGDIERL